MMINVSWLPNLLSWHRVASCFLPCFVYLLTTFSFIQRSLTFFLLLLGSKSFFTFTLSITSTLAPWFTRCWFVKPKTSSIRYSRIVESYISVPPLSQLGCVSTIWECPSGNNLTTWNFTRLWHFQLLFGCNWALVIDVLYRIFLAAVDVGLFSDIVLKCSLVRWHHVKVEGWVN